ncbi:MAG TPA: MnhB domain-containing protein [Oceanipulchritudo sp.]|nr:MnhB domain-containing protein [Oceanipulchritudo sp.]
MIQGTDSVVVRLSCRVVARIIQVFAIYVVFHGHYSPGGGFQGGGLLAAAVILLRIGEGLESSQRELPSRHALMIGSIGALVFLLSGIANVIFGGRYLQYDSLPFKAIPPEDLHYWEILVIEIGVALAVMGILVAIFDRLMEGVPDDD